MTSEERREARYQRRKEKRKLKREKHFLLYDDEKKLTSLNNLRKSVKQCSKGVRWKSSIPRYNHNYLYYITKARLDILQNKNITKGFICFVVYERGKLRKIKAVKIEERVIQKTLCREVLLPALKKYLITDNGACIKGKGTQFAIKRCTQQLCRYFKENGNEGYVYQFDFKSYFDSIPLDGLYRMLLEDFKDGIIRKILYDLLDSFRKFGDHELGLGSEVSQICAVYYLNKFDHLIKDQMGVKSYNRYMDDGYLLFKTKEEAKQCHKLLSDFIKSLGISFNSNKTHISKIENGFTYLKVRFLLKDNGKVVRTISSSRFVRERRKLKKYRKFVDEGIMMIDDVCQQASSVMGTFKYAESYHARRNLQKTFNKLFNKDYHRRLKINGKIIIAKSNNDTNTIKGGLLYQLPNY